MKTDLSLIIAEGEGQTVEFKERLSRIDRSWTPATDRLRKEHQIHHHRVTAAWVAEDAATGN